MSLDVKNFGQSSIKYEDIHSFFNSRLTND
jgi:hypothetical protein